jgi:trehalose 6-phosphate synthase/phosphatase
MSDRLVIVSNRLPFQMKQVEGRPKLVPSCGGLISALQRVVREHNSIWIGWPGCQESDEALDAFCEIKQQSRFLLEPIFLNDLECKQFYCGFSNEIVWPLFHDLQSHCNFDPAYWEAYQAVNLRFADRVSDFATASDLIWVHDYHLLEVARYLRRNHLRSRIVFFQHIPFPPPDIFEKLPWRTEILAAMLHYDVIGFQTSRDHRNFLNCLRLLPEKPVAISHGSSHLVEFEGRTVQIGAYPIGIDFAEFSLGASNEEVKAQASEIRRTLGDRRIILGIDRLDYTKGIPERLVAFREFLRRNPAMHRKVTFLQVAVPSREAIPKYQELKMEIESLIGTINGEFTELGWMPIHYIHRSLTRNELLAYYRAAEIALVTPLKDGMNLVAKEFCACKLNNDGILILSEFAGAAAECRRGALLVNPYDVMGVAEAISRALAMDVAERRGRMRQLRRHFRRNDVYRWSRHFVRAAEIERLVRTPTESALWPSLELSASGLEG